MNLAFLNNYQMAIKQCFIAFCNNDQHYLRFQHPIACDSVDSYSPVFAISAYLTQCLPGMYKKLSTPAVAQLQVLQSQIISEFHASFETWNQYLITCIINNCSYRIEDKFYIVIDVQQNFFEILLKNTDKNTEQFIPEKFINKIESLQYIFGVRVQQRTKRVGVFVTMKVEQCNFFKPRINLVANFLNIFDNQIWKIFDITKGEIPTVEEMTGLGAVIITGSPYSVLNKSQDIQQMITKLEQALKTTQHLKVLGICYGHQLILHHFGAQVVSKKSIQGLQVINLKQDVIKKYSFLSALEGRERLMMTISHGDYVQTLPNGFYLLGESESCSIESTISEDGRIFTTQFHGEVLLANFKRLFEQRAQITNDAKYKDRLIESQQRVRQNVQDSQVIIGVMTKFIS